MQFDFMLIILIIALPLMANIIVNSNYKKYLKEKNTRNKTGAEIAREILDRNGLEEVKIHKGTAHLSDHFDPRSNIVVLSPEVHDNASIASIAIAAHETGHAIQYKEGYNYLKLRSALVPVVNFSSRISTIFLFLGLMLNFLQLFDIGIILLSVGLLFQLITLPVEFNASKRAKKQLDTLALVSSGEEQVGVGKVLNAAAFTYVAGFLAMALQILRLVALRSND